MKKKNKTEEAPSKERTGGLGEYKGHSIGSVIKRLGLADVTAAHALAIMRILGVDKKAASAETFRNTVAWNITAGKSGRGKVAELTKAEVDELVAMAPEPVAEPKPAKPAKKGKAKAKAKGGRKPKVAKAVEAEAEGAPVETQPVAA